MDPLDEMQSWLGLGPEDSERLRGVLPLVEPAFPPIADTFYAEILRHPGSAAVLTGPAQVERLKQTLIRWLRELFEGPIDAAYAERRRAIGRRHVAVGLPDRYMFMAMHVVQRELTAVIRSRCAEPAPVLESLHRVLMLDLALMTGTYVEGREAMQLDALQALLVKHLRLSVFLTDADGVVRAATQASARIAGIDDPLGKHWTDVLPPGLLAAGRLQEEVDRARRRHRAVTLPRVDVPSDGMVRSFRVHLVPLEHHLASLLIQLEELTDAVEMEARLRNKEALAQLGALSAAVSHELRNPLAGISGALQVLSRSMPEGASHRKILEKIDAEVRRLNALVTDLLAFARPDTTRISEVALHELAGETVELLRSDNPGVRFELEGRGVALADPDQVRQILHNLLRNAVDAVEGHGTVRVDVQDGRIQVSDTGCGIPVCQRSKIFEPFVTTKTRGTGLGLAISRRSAEAMRGTLELTEGPLCGACFELRLPEPGGATSNRTSPSGTGAHSG